MKRAIINHHASRQRTRSRRGIFLKPFLGGAVRRSIRYRAGSRDIFHSRSRLALTYSRKRNERRHRNAEGGRSRAGVQSGGGERHAGREGARDGFAVAVSDARAGDSGISARHVVTELREAHGPVRAIERRDCEGRSTVDLHRGGKTRGFLQAGKVSSEAPSQFSISAG